MKINYLIIAACLSLLVSACANPAAKSTAEPKQGNGAVLAPTKIMDATEFLTFAESFANLPQEAQRLELASTNQALALNPNDLLNRMKLVMMLGLPSSSFTDMPKAQNLLQQLLQENVLANAQLAFGHVLFDYLIVQNKSNKNDLKHEAFQQKNETLQLKLEATQQKLDAALTKLDASQSKLEASQTKLDAVQQKLDKLKNIEQSMSGREPVPKPELTPKK